MENTRSDGLLMEILQERKTITGFLDAVFGFLKRNTDFYHIKKNESDQIGFPQGIREQIVYGCMQHYDRDCPSDYMILKDDYGEQAPPAVQEVELEAETYGEAADTECIEKPEVKNRTFVPSDYRNGAVHANYCWSQTLKDVELHILLPKELSSAKQVVIETKPNYLTVRSRDNPGVVILEGEPSSRYKHNDVVWLLDEGRLTINLDKSKEGWWEKLFVTDDNIDIKKLECERYIDELPEESQAAIQKLRIQQIEKDHEKLSKMRTNNETLERLRQAWDAEGSPFRGQPFDPSLLDFS